MKRAGFNVVRMGDLSWDSFERSQGKFTFEWFDSIMDKMHAAGIRVILDIPGLPAPIWLHRTYPGVDTRYVAFSWSAGSRYARGLHI